MEGQPHSGRGRGPTCSDMWASQLVGAGQQSAHPEETKAPRDPQGGGVQGPGGRKERTGAHGEGRVHW